MSPEVAVYGAGAVGGYLGGLLSLAGSPVTLLARPAMASAVAARGLVIREGERERVAHPRVVTEADALAAPDLIFLTVRTFDVAAALPALRQMLGPEGRLVAWQNGVGTEEQLAAGLGRELVLVGSLTVSVVMDEPGVIARTSRRGGVALATMDGSEVPARLVNLLAATGLPLRTVADYRALRWSKLWLNLLGAASSAILDMPVVELMAQPALFRLEQLAARETSRVMDRAGIPAVALPGYPVPLARQAMRLPRPLAQRLLGPRIAGARRGRSPGMRADLTRARSEIDCFHGAVAARGRELGVPVPVTTVLSELVTCLVQHPEERAAWRGQVARLVDAARASERQAAR